MWYNSILLQIWLTHASLAVLRHIVENQTGGSESPVWKDLINFPPGEFVILKLLMQRKCDALGRVRNYPSYNEYAWCSA